MQASEPEHLLFESYKRLQQLVADMPEEGRWVFDCLKAIAPVAAWFGPPGTIAAAGLYSVSLTQNLLQNSVQHRIHQAELEARKGELPPQICNTLHRYEEAKKAEKRAVHELLNQMAKHLEDQYARRELARKRAMLTGRRA